MSDYDFHPTISVVIPSYNEEKFIGRTIASVQKAGEYYRKKKNLSIEIIVVDNHSKDRTAEIARGEGAKVVFEPYKNISRASNIGALVAAGDFLVFLDADMEVSPDLLDAIDDNLMDASVAGGGTRCKADRFHLGFFLYSQVLDVYRLLFGGFTGVMHCRAKEFKELLGFDESLFIAEKVEFFQRMKAYGKVRNLRIKNASRGYAVQSTRMIRQIGFFRAFAKLAGLLIGTGKKVRDPEYCQPWYDPRR